MHLIIIITRLSNYQRHTSYLPPRELRIKVTGVNPRPPAPAQDNSGGPAQLQSTVWHQPRPCLHPHPNSLCSCSFLPSLLDGC